MSPRHVSLFTFWIFALLAPGCEHEEDTRPAQDPPREEGAPEPGPGAEPVARTVRLRVLAFNDFHGNLEPPNGSSGAVVIGVDPAGVPSTVPAGGASYFAAHVAALRAENPNTVVVSAGDLVGASPLVSALFHDEPTIEAMNLIGLDIHALGNHEFDEGGAELLRLQFGGCHPGDGCADGSGFGGARFSFLGANVLVDRAAGETLFPRYEIREYEGVPVAFIGMTLEGTPSVVDPGAIAGLEFADEAETVNTLVPELTALGVRAIVVVLHEGGLQTGFYDQCEGISGAIVDIAERLDPAVDAVVSGHTHAAYNCEIAGKRVTSALSFGRLLTTLDLVLDASTGDVVAIDAKNRVVGRDVAPDPAVGALVERYLAQVAPLRDRVVGHAEVALLAPRSPSGTTAAGESSLGDVIADAQLAATSGAQGDAEIAFMNPGGIRGDIEAGPITFGDVFAVQPFGNTLVTVTLTGAQLHTLLEQQFVSASPRILQPSAGFSYAWSASAPVGAKVDPVSIRLRGAPVSPDAKIRVTVNSFLVLGGDGFTILTESTDPLGGPVDLDALEAHLSANDPVVAPTLDRITLVP